MGGNYYLDFLSLHLGEPDPQLSDTSLEATASSAPAHRPLQQEAAAWPAVMAFLTAVVLPTGRTDLIMHETMDREYEQYKFFFLSQGQLLCCIGTGIHFAVNFRKLSGL
jgi:hypothetical protein